jgi:hypothetical protein
LFQPHYFIEEVRIKNRKKIGLILKLTVLSSPGSIQLSLSQAKADPSIAWARYQYRNKLRRMGSGMTRRNSPRMHRKMLKMKMLFLITREMHQTMQSHQRRRMRTQLQRDLHSLRRPTSFWLPPMSLVSLKQC